MDDVARVAGIPERREPLVRRAARHLAMSAPRGIALACLVAILAGCGDGSALAPVTDEGRSIAGLWWLLLAAGTAIYLLVMAALAVPLWRSRRQDPQDDTSPDPEADGKVRLRLIVGGGLLLPVVVVLAVVVAGATVGASVAPGESEGDLVIEVTGHQFWWEVEYPDLGVVTANEIHVPLDQPVRLHLRSADVIHSFWVPELHGKVDLRPGAETRLSFQVDAPGTYRGRCAEFCGIAHAQMELLVVVDEPTDFEAWAGRQAEPAAAPASDRAGTGREIFADSCAACHTVRGHHRAAEADGVAFAPDLTHLASRRTIAAALLENGRDELRRWITDPHGVKPGAGMPPADLHADELEALLDYLEGLE